MPCVAQLGPGLDVFLDAFDLDWPVFKRALEELRSIPGAQPSDLDGRVPGWQVLRRCAAGRTACGASLIHAALVPGAPALACAGCNAAAVVTGTHSALQR